MLKSSSAEPSVRRSPWHSRPRRFFLPLMRISGLAIRLLEVEVAPVEEDLGVVIGDVAAPAEQKSLSSDRPTVVTACGRCIRAARLAAGSISGSASGDRS